MNKIKQIMMNKMKKNEKIKKIMMKIRKKNSVSKESQVLKCQICEHTEPVPMHCMEIMHIESIDEKEQLVCWMGPFCGVQEIPSHHNIPMKIVTDEKELLIKVK